MSSKLSMDLKNNYNMREYKPYDSRIIPDLSLNNRDQAGTFPNDTPMRSVNEMQDRNRNSFLNSAQRETCAKSPGYLNLSSSNLWRASPSPLMIGGCNKNINQVGGPSASFEKLRMEALRSGHLFCDAAFPADDSSLYYSQRPPCHIVWMRPSEIVAANSGGGVVGIAPRKIRVPEFIGEGGAQLGELRQGELGDCWVVAALAAISAQPSLLTRVIPVGQSFRPEWYAGMFAFRFWRFGHWEEVIIDDRLPTRPGGQPLFVHSGRTTEFWPALLEKAYAKLNGSYEALNVGLVGDAMDDLTGGLTESYILPAAEEQVTQLPPDLDDILIKSFDRRSLLTARIKTKGIPGPGFVIPSGFVPGQAFGLTDCRKLRLTDTAGSRLVRLVRLRNLWPAVRVGWTGAWSEGSNEWLSLPAQDRIKVGLVKSEDEFWTSLEDFIANFEYLDICHLTEPAPPTPSAPTTVQPSPNFPASHLRGRWLRGVSCGGRPYIRASHWANPQFRLVIGSPDSNDPDGLASVVIALMQADRRRLRHRAPRLASIGFVLYRLPSGSHPPMPRGFFESNHHTASVDFFFDSREVVKRFRLLPGEYLIVPCTYSPDQPGDFLLRVLFDSVDRSCEPALERVELSGLAASGPDSDSYFDIIQPRLRRLFYEASGEAMAVDAFQLEPILNCLLRDDHRAPYTMVNIDACRALVALLDRDGTGRLSESDFRRVWEILRCWSRLFASFDPQRTGYVTSLDFRIIIEQAGYTLPHSLLSRLVHRFVDVDWRLDYAKFINAMALITKTIGKFRSSLSTSHFQKLRSWWSSYTFFGTVSRRGAHHVGFPSLVTTQ
ncbi:Calpain family cysteine protease [Paragonimus heterotremus]|uniref:Calpain family cysteine protease n=1 Tax=Paragonimus heterotremus TaxID=100268 RepID=A0A8J4WI45_9TREM|nr:Calpain family cysteine protease [Paragonimus heterotremus]